MTNVATHTKTAGDLIREALRASNIVGAEMPVEAVEIVNGHTALNDILKHWQAQGIHLWSETEALMPLNPDQKSYTVGTDHCFTDFVYTTITADFSAAAVSFTVASTTGMTVGDSIGIQLSDGTRWWGEIDTIPDSTTVTTTTGVTGAGVSGAEVYAYTDMIDQPLRVLSVRHGYSYTADELCVEQMARKEYFDQPSKGTTGNVNQWYFSRQLNAGILYVWPVARICTQLLRFTFTKPQYVPQNQIDEIPVPDEWFLPLKWAVAAELGVIYAIDAERQVIIESKAQSLLQQALDYDVEIEAFSIQPG